MRADALDLEAAQGAGSTKTMKYANSWSGSMSGGDREMRMGAGWLSHMVRRARELLFTHRRRHRPVLYDGREFSTPQLLSEALLPRGPAMYAIQVRHWWSGLKPIHFGTSPNLHEELMVDGHEAFVHWLTRREARRGLFVSFRLDRNLDHDGYRRETTRLDRHYFPRRTHSLEEHLALHRIHRTSEHHRHPSHNGDDSIR